MNNINAIKDSWILVSSGAKTIEVSIQNIFCENSGFSGIAEGYWKGIAPLRLLSAVAMAALRPKTNEEIVAYFDDLSGFCRTIQKYLDAWKDSFWLFHEKKPFLQVAFLKTDYPYCPDSKYKGFVRKSTNDLIWAEGLKTTELKSPSKDYSNTPAGILRSLLYSQILGGNMKYGYTPPAGPLLKPDGQVYSFQSCPSVSLTTNGGSTATLNIHPYDPCNLLKTVILNMIPEEDVVKIWSKGMGEPIWELPIWDDYSKFSKISGTIESTFLGRLVPINKFIWVDPNFPDQMIYSSAEGINYLEALQKLKITGNFDGSYYLPPHNIKGKATLGTLRENSSLWRDFAAMNISKSTPTVLKKFKILENEENVLIAASALISSGSMGLVYGEKMIDSFLLWKIKGLKEYLKGNKNPLTPLSEVAETMAIKLYSAINGFNKEMGLRSDGKNAEGNKNKILYHFWTVLNCDFQKFLNKINDIDINEKWEKFVKETAEKSLRMLKDSNSRRNKAVAIAVKSLS